MFIISQIKYLIAFISIIYKTLSPMREKSRIFFHSQENQKEFRLITFQKG